MMNFIPYDRWLKQNPDLDTEIDCEECEGSGRYYHDCEHCRGHECETCGGVGRIRNSTARSIYEAECAKAKTLLQAAQRGGEGE